MSHPDKFAFMTVTGFYNGKASGVGTVAGEYEGLSDLDIRRNLLARASDTRSERWRSSASHLVISGFGIYPAVVRPEEYSHASLSMQSWWERQHPSAGGNALTPIEDEMRTAELYNRAKSEAVTDWDRNTFMSSLGYVAVVSFELLDAHPE